MILGLLTPRVDPMALSSYVDRVLSLGLMYIVQSSSTPFNSYVVVPLALSSLLCFFVEPLRLACNGCLLSCCCVEDEEGL